VNAKPVRNDDLAKLLGVIYAFFNDELWEGNASNGKGREQNVLDVADDSEVRTPESRFRPVIDVGVA